MVDLVLDDKVATRAASRPSVGMSADVSVRGISSSQAVTEQNMIRLQSDTVLAVDKFIYSQTGADTVTDTELDLRAVKFSGMLRNFSRVPIHRQNSDRRSRHPGHDLRARRGRQHNGHFQARLWFHRLDPTARFSRPFCPLAISLILITNQVTHLTRQEVRRRLEPLKPSSRWCGDDFVRGGQYHRVCLGGHGQVMTGHPRLGANFQTSAALSCAGFSFNPMA